MAFYSRIWSIMCSDPFAIAWESSGTRASAFQQWKKGALKRSLKILIPFFIFFSSDSFLSLKGFVIKSRTCILVEISHELRLLFYDEVVEYNGLGTAHLNTKFPFYLLFKKGFFLSFPDGLIIRDTYAVTGLPKRFSPRALSAYIKVIRRISSVL